MMWWRLDHTFCLCFIVCALFITGGCMVCVCCHYSKLSVLHLETSLCSPGETCGSRVAQTNGQLMGLQTARLVPKCLQIKQFIILCVYTHTHRNTYAYAWGLSQCVHRLLSFSKHLTDQRLCVLVMECNCNCVFYMETMSWWTKNDRKFMSK